MGKSNDKGSIPLSEDSSFQVARTALARAGGYSAQPLRITAANLAPLPASNPPFTMLTIALPLVKAVWAMLKATSCLGSSIFDPRDLF
jgi:hypothetical protein